MRSELSQWTIIHFTIDKLQMQEYTAWTNKNATQQIVPNARLDVSAISSDGNGATDG